MSKRLINSSRYALIAGVALSLCALGPIAPTARADGEPWFDKDAAKTVFGPEIEVRVARVKEKPVMQPANLETKPPSDATQPAEQTEEPKDLKAALESKYGSPSAAPTIKAIESAPAPYKAMLEAHTKGDDELAYQYAQQYVRYIRGVQNANTFVVGLASQAIKEERSAADEGAVSDSPTSSQKKAEDAIQALIKRAEDAEGIKLQELGSEVLDSADGGKDRAALRAALLQAEVPVDPEGKVDVFFFMNPNELSSQRAAADFELLYLSRKSDKRINFVGVTASHPLPGAITEFKQRTNVSFPIKNGSKLSAALGVQQVPAIVFMSPNTKQVVADGANRDVRFYQELIRAMQGGR